MAEDVLIELQDEEVPDGFSPDTIVLVQEDDQSNRFWFVKGKIQYKGKTNTFSVPIDRRTDFASVPSPFVWLIPTYGKYTKAAILHDYLCEERPISRLDTDGLFRRAMRDLEVPFLRRWFMWAGVRWGAVLKKKDREGWWKELPRVVLFSILAIPVVLPPAVLIFLALLLFYVEEAVVWVFLQLGSLLKRGPKKQVNAPKLYLKT